MPNWKKVLDAALMRVEGREATKDEVLILERSSEAFRAYVEKAKVTAYFRKTGHQVERCYKFHPVPPRTRSSTTSQSEIDSKMDQVVSHLLVRHVDTSVFHDEHYCLYDVLVSEMAVELGQKITDLTKAAEIEVDNRAQLRREIEAKKAEVTRNRHRRAVDRLTSFMVRYPDHVYTEEEALEACRLATVKKIQHQ